MEKNPFKSLIYCFTLLIFLSSSGPDKVLGQTKAEETIEAAAKLGNIVFFVREMESTPSPQKLLEVQIEVFNGSRRLILPPNSVKVVVTPKEVKYSDPEAKEEYAPASDEVSLSVPLAPRASRIVIIGFPLPKEKVESISFEVQVNPPEGEKKVVTWSGV